MKGLERYIRQTTFSELGIDGQKELGKKKALLAGCGALGSAIGVSIVRSGIGELRIVDHDFPEIINLHRQFLYDEDNVRGKIPKAIIAAQKLGRANSQVKVIPIVTELSSNNIEELAKGVDLIMDGTDNLQTRYIINDFSIKYGVPWIYGGVIGASGMMMMVIPGKTACFRCLFPEQPPAEAIASCKTAGVLNPAPMLIAALESIEAIKYLSGKGKPRSGLLQFDLWGETLHATAIKKNPSCPACGKKKFEYLGKKQTEWTGRVCGDNAIKVVPPRNLKLNLKALGNRLRKFGKVTFNGYILEAKLTGKKIIVFADGRAIIYGTLDGEKALAVYRKYLEAMEVGS